LINVVDLQKILAELEDCYRTGKDEHRKRKEEALIRKKVKKLEEIKKKENEERERQSRRDQMFQEYLTEVELRKKEKTIAQLKKPPEDNETIKKRNEERLNKKLERVRKQAESEKKRVQDLEKRLQQQQELKQMTIEKHQMFSKKIRVSKKPIGSFNRYMNSPTVQTDYGRAMQTATIPVKKSVDFNGKKLLHLTTDSIIPTGKLEEIARKSEEGHVSVVNEYSDNNPNDTKTLLRTISQKEIEERKLKKLKLGPIEKAIISVYNPKGRNSMSPGKKAA